MSESRPAAPFGQRFVPVVEAGPSGAYQRIVLSDLEAPRVRAGQFHMLSVTTGQGTERGRPWLPRAISFSEADGSGRIAFLVDPVGPGTRAMAELEAGDEIGVVGPLGNGFPDPAPDRYPVVVGGGVGLAPALALSAQLKEAGREHALVLGFRSADHAAAAAGFAEAVIATDDGSLGSPGNVMGPLNDLLAARDDCEVFACGPPAMMDAIRVEAVRLSIPAWLALEAPMACGFGACFGCAVETKDGIVRLCVDGPVLEAARLDGVSATGRIDP